MKTKHIAIALIALVVIAGGVFAATTLQEDDSSPPFNTTNSTNNSTGNTTQLPQGVVENRLTQEAVALSSLRLSQNRTTITIEKTVGSQTTTQRTVYTPEKSYEIIERDPGTNEERFYTLDYTAIQTFHNDGYELTLDNPQNQISYHTQEQYFRTVTQSLNLTLSNTNEVNGTTQYVFTSDEITTTARSPLAQYFGVNTINSVNEASVTLTENGVITNSSLSVQVSKNDNSYPISKTYSITQTPNATVTQSEWVTEALQTNAKVQPYIVSDTELVLQHQYGRTIQAGDIIEIQSPTGKTYTNEVNQSFGPGDRAVLTKQNNTLNMTLNPNSSVEGGTEYLSEQGTYIITIQSQEEGVVTFTTAQR